MTTTKTTRFRLPDPPEREPDERTSTKHLATFDDERAARIQAEARSRELEEELRRLRGE